jgi:outer membrane protein OmpA-like peptidoglycan-associated protein
VKKLLVSVFVSGLVFSSALFAEDCVMVEELNVEFKNASSTYLDATEAQKVGNFAKFMKKTDLYAVIEGHTNRLSNATYNYHLSTERATKVMMHLIELGVDKANIRAMGFGESSPLYDNNTEDGLIKNRRVIAEVFNSADELDAYVKEQKARIKDIKFSEQ